MYHIVKEFWFPGMELVPQIEVFRFSVIRKAEKEQCARTC